MEYKGKEYWFCSPNCDLNPENDCDLCKKIYDEKQKLTTNK